MSPEDEVSGLKKVQQGDIYQVFRDRDKLVLSTSDINREIDWASRSTVHRRLKQMRKDGKLRSKKAGDKENEGKVWYIPDELNEVPQPTPDKIRLVYRNIWLFLAGTGIVIVAVGFALFLPGIIGEGQYLGLIDRDLLVLVSLIMYFIGVPMVILGGIGVLGKTIRPIVQNRL